MKRCGIQELESLGQQMGSDSNEAEKSDDESNSNLYWQAAIFKVGDDVRQVRMDTAGKGRLVFSFELTVFTVVV